MPQRFSGEGLMESGLKGMAVCCILVAVLATVIALLAITGKYNLFAELAKEDTRALEHALQSQQQNRH